MTIFSSYTAKNAIEFGNITRKLENHAALVNQLSHINAGNVINFTRRLNYYINICIASATMNEGLFAITVIIRATVNLLSQITFKQNIYQPSLCYTNVPSVKKPYRIPQL